MVFRFYDQLPGWVLPGLFTMLTTVSSAGEYPETHVEALIRTTRGLIRENLEILHLRDADSCAIEESPVPKGPVEELLGGILAGTLAESGLQVYRRFEAGPSMTRIQWKPQRVVVEYSSVSPGYPGQHQGILRTLDVGLFLTVTRAGDGRVVFHDALTAQFQDTLRWTDLDAVERGGESVFGNPQRPEKNRPFRMLEVIGLVLSVALTGFLLYVIRN